MLIILILLALPPNRVLVYIMLILMVTGSLIIYSVLGQGPLMLMEYLIHLINGA